MGHITFWSDDALHCFVTHISRDNVTVKPLGMGWTELALKKFLYFERACIFLSCFVQIESILILSKVFVHVASSYKFYQGLVFRFPYWWCWWFRGHFVARQPSCSAIRATWPKTTLYTRRCIRKLLREEWEERWGILLQTSRKFSRI